MLDDFVTGERAVARGLFQPDFLRQLAQEHCDQQADHTERLWTLVNFEMWQRTFLDGEPLLGGLPLVNEVRRAS